MDRDRFESLVIEAVQSLPQEFQDRLENIDVLVDERPASYQLDRADLEQGQTLLGLYEGVPLTERTSGYGMVLPDKITIFQRPIEDKCRNDEEIIGEVQRVVLHEIAHHFGIGDDRLDEIEEERYSR